jgi:hypothetical protein
MFFWIPASAGMTNIVKGFMTHTTRGPGFKWSSELLKKELKNLNP